MACEGEPVKGRRAQERSPGLEEMRASVPCSGALCTPAAYSPPMISCLQCVGRRRTSSRAPRSTVDRAIGSSASAALAAARPTRRSHPASPATSSPCDKHTHTEPARPPLRRSCSKRADTSPVKAVVRETIMERQVLFSRATDKDLPFVNVLWAQTSAQRSAGPQPQRPRCQEGPVAHRPAPPYRMGLPRPPPQPPDPAPQPPPRQPLGPAAACPRARLVSTLRIGMAAARGAATRLHGLTAGRRSR